MKLASGFEESEPDREGLPPGSVGTSAHKETNKASGYAYLALGLLTLVNFVNYVDRQIIAIIAASIQKDLLFSDAQLGFLMGTAFVTLYGVFGISMGRIADLLSRSRVLAVGLALWSAMTVASGLAVNFLTLALARIGVGIGEAVANPCSHSLLADFFPARNRSTVLGIYLLGTPLGGAAAMLIGGMLVGHWPQICTSLPVGMCGLSDWQAAFLIVGVPGLLLAGVIALLREPVPRPKLPEATSRVVARELSLAVPPLTLFNVHALGGIKALRANVTMACVLLAVSCTLALLTGDWAQWIAVAIGLYSVLTWSSVLRMRDAPLHALTFGSRTFILLMCAGGIIAIMVATVTAWAAPYALRELKASPTQLGMYLGGASIAAAAIAGVLGGVITDRWKRKDPRGPVWLGMICLIGPAVPLVVMVMTTKLGVFIGAFFCVVVFSTAWLGGFAALVQDLVLPRMRGTASAAFSLVIILFSSGLGPYWVGKISSLTHSLTTGLISLLAALPIGIVLLLMVAKRLKHETHDVRRQRAISAGEPA